MYVSYLCLSGVSPWVAGVCLFSVSCFLCVVIVSLVCVGLCLSRFPAYVCIGVLVLCVCRVYVSVLFFCFGV